LILLIRHGETPGNAARVVQTPETPLSERGVGQARRLGARLAGEAVGGILASDLERAAMTARCVADATDAPITFEPLLHERNFGDLRGTPYAELGVDLFAPELVPPGGESWQTFHGLVCLSITTRCAALSPTETPELTGFANTSVTRIEHTPPHRVMLLDCTEHLTQVDRNGGRV